MIRGKKSLPLLCLIVSALLAGGPPFLKAATVPPEGMDQKQVAERLASLQHEISQLRLKLEASREEHKSEQAQLRSLDLTIQATAHQLRDLKNQISAHLKELEDLENRRDGQVSKLQRQQEQLASQIGATYRLASESRLKLVLNQDSPARISRMLAYYDHINRVQVAKIQAVKAILEELDHIYELIEAELVRIKAVQSEQQQALDRQQRQRNERNDFLAALAGKIDDAESRIRDLERDRKDLEILLQKLTDVFADIPADLGQHLSITEQKGMLPRPVKGRILHAFGQRRAAGMNWQGWLMDAAIGTEVVNIAYGRVAFADWLRGYGLLIIIDHGQGFMSLYGYNESLLWDVGDWVEPGTVIATVGGSQGGEQGLYFEMRRKGKAIDPAVWLKR